MPNHGGLRHCGVANNLSYNVSDKDAFCRIRCGHCGTFTSAAVVAMTHTTEAPEVLWLRCTHCQGGSVISSGKLFPGPMPGDDLAGLPEDVAEAYNEARRCFAVNAFTGCELVCRKLLMHVAVDAAEAESGKSFAVVRRRAANRRFHHAADEALG